MRKILFISIPFRSPALCKKGMGESQTCWLEIRNDEESRGTMTEYQFT